MPSTRVTRSSTAAAAASTATDGLFKSKNDIVKDEVLVPTSNGKLNKFTFTEKATTVLKPPTTAATSSPKTKTKPKPKTSTDSSPRSPLKRERDESEDDKEEVKLEVASIKRRKSPAKASASYAPPSTYAHLNGVPDCLGPDMICMLIGLNPGIATANAGHCYASPTNHFWRLLHHGGLTPSRLPPSADRTLPTLYSLGTTNIVSRPTANQAQLSKQEMDASVPELEQKVRMYRPLSVCIIGKAIWESIWRAKHGGKNVGKDKFKFGWQDDEERMGVDEEEGFEGARVFVVMSTSALAAGYSMDEKKTLWKELGDWINERRRERGIVAGVAGVAGDGGQDGGMDEDVKDEMAQ